MHEVPERSVAPPPSFEDFFAKEYRSVLGLAYVLSGNRWAAEDLAQDAFLAAHREWSRVSGLERPDAWVRRVLANRSVSAFRRRAVEVRALVRLAGGQPGSLPELSAESAEFWREVRSLPRRQAQVVALFYLDDRSTAEIADVLDMAPGTVRKHLHDGRRRLAERLGVMGADA